MPADLFDYWLAYSRLKPFGHQDRLLAQIMTRYYNATRNEGDEPADIDAFLPVYRTEAELLKREEEKMLAEMMKEKG